MLKLDENVTLTQFIYVRQLSKTHVTRIHVRQNIANIITGIYQHDAGFLQSC